MTLALCCMSHSPLLELADPGPELTADVQAAFETARSFVRSYNPDLVVVFAPDHYNGFFYELMPPFCVGLAATSIGDYGSEPGPLDVPRDVAEQCAKAALEGGVDLAVSLRMEIDHGAVQPLEILLGGIRHRPVVPFFINSVAPPFTSISRVRTLGAAVGRYLATLDRRVLLIGSGGLSHEPPVPTLDTAPAEVAEGLIAGRHPSAEARAARQERVVAAAHQFAAGAGNLKPLNPDWDQAFLDQLAANDLDAIDRYTNEGIETQGGKSGQEIRTWVAAYGALTAAGSYQMTSRYYRPIPEFIAGFAVTTAVPVGTKAATTTR
jgi:2,3-dihydroxyphenylpropionate 1,2-dioxygenase